MNKWKRKSVQAYKQKNSQQTNKKQTWNKVKTIFQQKTKRGKKEPKMGKGKKVKENVK